MRVAIDTAALSEECGIRTANSWNDYLSDFADSDVPTT